jgi:hypothetical protein
MPDNDKYQGDVRFENHEPGNATRYELVLVKTRNGLLMTWLMNAGLGGPSFLFRKGNDWPEVGYFMEKTGLTNEHDAKALIERAKAWHLEG